MNSFSERHTVQTPFIRYAEEAGWTYLPPEEARRLRGGEENPVLRGAHRAAPAPQPECGGFGGQGRGDAEPTRARATQHRGQP